MTLSGNLGFVPLDEVLRLLTRAGNAGVVEITNRDIRGRIFVTGAGIGLATTFDDHDLKDHLIRSGYLSADAASSAGIAFNDDLVGIIREMTVESIYRMDGDNADFEVVSDATSAYASPEPFDLERILDDSRKRAEQWESVTRRVPDLDATMKINRTLTAETVELDRASWRILSEIGSGATVKDLATRLGTTKYAVASVVATMVDSELLVFGGGAVATAPVYESVKQIVDEAPTHVDETEVDPDRSWWDEPEVEQPAGVEDTEPQPAAAGTDDISEEHADSDDLADSDTVDGAEDTDAFLEKVFSEVRTEPSEEDGHGLMRRRRMGSILRELGEE